MKGRKKGKAKGKPGAPPPVHKFPGRRAASRAEPEDDAPKAAAVHKFSGKRRDAEPAAKPPAPKGMAARLAAMAAASAEMDAEPDVKSKAAGSAPANPKGGVAWEDFEDDDAPAAPPPAKAAAEPAMEFAAPPAGPPKAVDEGVQVVAKGASKFSAADLELLRSAIKVKGAASVIEGVNLDELKWDDEGLVPVVTQDRRTGAVLMLAHANRETLEQTLRTKTATYWSRPRGKAWTPGEGEGHAQRVVRLSVDCDKDAILLLVDHDGPACHRDTGTCWSEGREVPPATFLGELDRIVRDRAKHPRPDSATNKLLAEPIQALRRFVEEANEVTRNIQGKATNESLEHAVGDLLYHLLVVLRTKGVGLGEVLTELQARHLAMEMQKAKS
ncbi:MAG: phosphoribosyl-AMP cyclohydrolase / phosphoribosyl-ATP pyrophosphohydrolase [Thermoplasmata archaeon]|jgi:phosphoribosyl-ATP pyrophosphohydrolase/phosphoribosyl-AMP cyclohydrolase|nr:phosphoribosyl-AMP cyclohydrolase / phosphoribosyl-ATP pyrophosphohydrolase [Thermoplasmata archaeon]